MPNDGELLDSNSETACLGCVLNYGTLRFLVDHSTSTTFEYKVQDNFDNESEEACTINILACHTSCLNCEMQGNESDHKQRGKEN